MQILISVNERESLQTVNIETESASHHSLRRGQFAILHINFLENWKY
jgi:hypothetical protein